MHAEEVLEEAEVGIVVATRDLVDLDDLAGPSAVDPVAHTAQPQDVDPSSMPVSQAEGLQQAVLGGIAGAADDRT